MSILFQLSSQQKDRSEKANRIVAARILKNPELLRDILYSLNSQDHALLGDCVEVCTMVAESEPELIAPDSDKILPLLRHKNTRVRWEAMHVTALLSPYVPEAVMAEWDYLIELFRTDKSVIVRDYIVTCAGNLAACGQTYAENVYPLLVEALSAHQTHHAKLALEGMTKGIENFNERRGEIEEYADLFIQHPKPSIKKAAQKLKKRLSTKQS